VIETSPVLRPAFEQSGSGVIVLRASSPSNKGEKKSQPRVIPRLPTFRDASVFEALQLEQAMMQDAKLSPSAIAHQRTHSVREALREGDLSLLRIREATNDASARMHRKWAWLYRSNLPVWKATQESGSHAVRALKLRLEHVRSRGVVPEEKPEKRHGSSEPSRTKTKRSSDAHPFFPASGSDRMGQHQARRSSPEAKRETKLPGTDESSVGTWEDVLRKAVASLPGNVLAASIAREQSSKTIRSHQATVSATANRQLLSGATSRKLAETQAAEYDEHETFASHSQSALGNLVHRSHIIAD